MSGVVNQVRFSVNEDGKETLVYYFDTIKDAIRMLDFLREFFPNARFVIEPPLH